MKLISFLFFVASNAAIECNSVINDRLASIFQFIDEKAHKEIDLLSGQLNLRLKELDNIYLYHTNLERLPIVQEEIKTIKSKGKKYTERLSILHDFSILMSDCMNKNASFFQVEDKCFDELEYFVKEKKYKSAKELEKTQNIQKKFVKILRNEKKEL